MKVSIDGDGFLVISPENDIEIYALKSWQEKNMRTMFSADKHKNLVEIDKIKINSVSENVNFSDERSLQGGLVNTRTNKPWRDMHNG